MLTLWKIIGSWSDINWWVGFLSIDYWSGVSISSYIRTETYILIRSNHTDSLVLFQIELTLLYPYSHYCSCSQIILIVFEEWKLKDSKHPKSEPSDRFWCETSLKSHQNNTGTRSEKWIVWLQGRLYTFAFCECFCKTHHEIQNAHYTLFSHKFCVLFMPRKSKPQNLLTFRVNAENADPGVKWCEMRKVKKVMRNTPLYTFCFSHFTPIFAYFMISVYSRPNEKE